MKLIIAEKPSVAKSIAKVVGANTQKDGYMEGNGYTISWCIGHLIQMANPSSYDEKYAKWKMDMLPILPKEYKYEVSKYTKKQYSVLHKLLKDTKFSEVINACDAGREGELIFRLVYNQAKSKIPVKRLWISSLEDQAIKDGMDNLRNSKDYDNLYYSATARAKADWLIGMNLSRLYSLLYAQNYSVGRVQTPTLAMIVKRDDAIENFKKEKYFTVSMISNGFSLTTDRIDDEKIASQLKNLIPERVEITSVEQTEKITKPELPFDLTTLQRECNKYFGYSAKQTLDYAQSLYEKKLITYPRTDSRCLTEDMITNTVNNILGKNNFDASRIKVVFNSSKVTDHHAIIPTASSLFMDMEKVPESERKVYQLISDKFHASMGYALKEEKTKILANFDGFDFKATGTVLIEEGFSKYLKAYKERKEDDKLPKLNKGSYIDVVERKIDEKYTKPPKRYTEDTLLKAMELAGKEDIKKGMEVEYPHHNLSSAHSSLDKLDWGRPSQGLGTPATRAGIIENLIAKDLIERNKKELVATNKGIALATVVSEFLKSPKTTAMWEMKLYDISKGGYTEQAFLTEIEKEIKDLIFQYEKVR